jgi:hypothetical protein
VRSIKNRDRVTQARPSSFNLLFVEELEGQKLTQRRSWDSRFVSFTYTRLSLFPLSKFLLPVSLSVIQKFNEMEISELGQAENCNEEVYFVTAWLTLFLNTIISPGRYQRQDLFMKVLRVLCPNLTDALTLFSNISGERLKGKDTRPVSRKLHMGPSLFSLKTEDPSVHWPHILTSWLTPLAHVFG